MLKTVALLKGRNTGRQTGSSCDLEFASATCSLSSIPTPFELILNQWPVLPRSELSEIVVIIMVQEVVRDWMLFKPLSDPIVSLGDTRVDT